MFNYGACAKWISILYRLFYWFHVRVWTCTCLTSSVHSALNKQAPAPPEHPLRTNYWKYLFLLQLCSPKKSKIGCNILEKGARVCMNVHIHLFPAVHIPMPQNQSLLWWGFFFLRSSFINTTWRNKSLAFIWRSLGWGVTGVGNLQIKILNGSQMRFGVGSLLLVAPVPFIPVCGARSRMRCSILPCDTTSRVRSW